MEETIKVSFKLKIKDVFVDGFEGVDLLQKQMFKSESTIKDNIALKNTSLKIGDNVIVAIELIDKEDIGDDIKDKEFYCVVNEITNNGFYTKGYDGEANRLKRQFWYKARGMITFTNPKINRFDIGDILKVSIRGEL